ncbi:hypothetical protein JXA31_05730 [Candidatus Bathyarchaeota archaeon]|nr:hypothetical protein [Candidatus Bathyarchaeota archaeon]
MTPPKLKTAKTLLFILIAALLTISLIQSAFPQSFSNTTVAVNPEAISAILDGTITVNITISNVQNLYGLDVTLLWNPSVLTVQNIDIRLGVESFPDGVLHEATSADIFIQENTVDQENGEYHLVATSVAPAPSFSGSGNIASLTFNVTSIGQSELILITELADYNPSGSNLIDHTDVNGALDSVIPEFPSIIAVILTMLLVTATAVLSRRILGKTNSKPKKPQL